MPYQIIIDQSCTLPALNGRIKALHQEQSESPETLGKSGDIVVPGTPTPVSADEFIILDEYSTLLPFISSVQLAFQNQGTTGFQGSDTQTTITITGQVPVSIKSDSSNPKDPKANRFVQVLYAA